MCPAHARSEVRHKAIDMSPKADHLDVERGELGVLRRDPRAGPVDREGLTTVKGSQLLRPLFEFSGACAGLRRDPVPEAAHAALRRPPAGGQRHRLLRRSTAATCRPRRGRSMPTGEGPAWCELAVRGQRGVRARHATGARREAIPRLGAARHARGRARRVMRSCASCNDAATRTQDGIRAAAPAARGAPSPPRSRSHRAEARDSRRDRRRAGAARAYGSSAATAGHTTSGSADSTTCSRVDAT